MNESSVIREPTILLADDEWLLIWSLERLLMKHGLCVLKAPTARAALDLLNKQTVDWVICDLKLPDASGLEVIETARRLYPRARLALMTAYGSLDVEDTARRLGAAYLPKPFDLDGLVETIVASQKLPA